MPEVRDRLLQIGGGGRRYRDHQARWRRGRILAIQEGDVARSVPRRRDRARPGAIDVVRDLHLARNVELTEPPDQQVAGRNRLRQVEGVRRDAVGDRGCRSLDEFGRLGRRGDHQGCRPRRMIVREVEGVNRIRVRGRWRHIRIQEGRGAEPCRPDGRAVSVHGIAGDAAGGRRPREGDPCRGHAGGLQAGGTGGWLRWAGGSGMEDCAHRVPVRLRGKGGSPVLVARGARGDVLFKGGSLRRLRARRVRDARAASRRHRAGRGRRHQGREHQLARAHGARRTGVNGRSIGSARRDHLVQRAGERDARILGDGSLQVGGRRDGDGDRHPAGCRLAVLAVIEGDVTRVIQEGQRLGRPRPGAVHVVRHLDPLGGIVLSKPPDQQVPLGNRAAERDGDRGDSRGRERGSLNEGRGGRLGDRRAWK